MNQSIAVGRLAGAAWMLGISTLVTTQVVDAQPQWGRWRTPAAGACFYRGANFQGSYFCAGPGEDIAFMSRGMNDQISSIRAFGDTEVTIFQDVRFRGRWTRLDGDVRDLRRGGWNDSLSSVRISRGYGRDRGRSFGQRRGSGLGRIETGVWRDDRGDRRDGSGAAANNPAYGRDSWGMGGNDPRDGRGGSSVGRHDPTNRRGGWPSAETADDVVRRLYQELLQREPDAQGLTIYRNRLNNDGWSEQQVRDALLQSPEYRQKGAAATRQNAEQIVARAYRSMLGREPDAASRVYVDKVLREDWTEADVARDIRNSPEYKNRRR